MDCRKTILVDNDDAPVIHVTGERSTKASNGATEMSARALLYRPFDNDRLLLTVAEALGTMEPSLAKKALDDLQATADQFAATRR